MLDDIEQAKDSRSVLWRKHEALLSYQGSSPSLTNDWVVTLRQK